MSVARGRQCHNERLRNLLALYLISIELLPWLVGYKDKQSKTGIKEHVEVRTLVQELAAAQP